MNAAPCAPAVAHPDRAFQGVFRPLVDRAWAAYCVTTGKSPKDKVARESWYRGSLRDAIGVETTKLADESQHRELIAYFKRWTPLEWEVHPDPVHLFFRCYSPAQNKNSIALARKAYAIERKRAPAAIPSFDDWTDAEISKVWKGEHVPGTSLTGSQGVYDEVMAQFAVIANDAFWLGRIAQGNEIRLRWQLKRYLVDLSYLYGRECGWEYLVGIWKQSKALPAVMDDAPADTLRQCLAMLDTHIRRICAKRMIKLEDLPTRHKAPGPTLVVSGSRPVGGEHETVPF